MIGYHVTNRRNREGIEARGLLTNVMGFEAGYVWFFLDPVQAFDSALKGAWGGERGNNDVWEIDLDGFEVLDDPHPGWGEDRSNRCVVHSIPVERIRLIDTASLIEVSA